LGGCAPGNAGRVNRESGNAGRINRESGNAGRINRESGNAGRVNRESGGCAPGDGESGHIVESSMRYLHTTLHDHRAGHPPSLCVANSA